MSHAEEDWFDLQETEGLIHSTIKEPLTLQVIYGHAGI
jgi:hypothetical protein